MEKEEILDIIEYQFGKEVKEKCKNLDLKIKKGKSRKIEIFSEGEPFLFLNPKFFLFNFSEEFAKILKECKKFYIKIDKKFLEDIKKTKNIIRKNVVEFTKDFRYGDDIIILDENDNLIAIAKAKMNSFEIENSTYGIIAKIKKFIKERN